MSSVTAPISSMHSREEKSQKISADFLIPTWLWLGLILIAGLSFRWPSIQERSLWFDEVLSWRMARAPLAELPDILKTSQHPPAYFVLLKGWMYLFEDTSTGIRSLSVVAGLLTILGTYLFLFELLSSSWGRAWPGEARRAALIGAALIAFSQLQIRYAWETRMYALGSALSVFSSWLLVRAMTRPSHPWKHWALYGVVGLLFQLTHNIAALTITAQGLIVAWWMCERASGRWWRIYRDPQIGPIVLAYGIMVVGIVAWSSVLLVQLSNSGSRSWIPPLEKLDQLFRLTYQIFVDPQKYRPSQGAAARTAVVLGSFLLLTGYRNRPADWVVLALGVIPFGLALLMCGMGMSVMNQRYFCFCQPFLLASLALTLARIRSPLLAQTLTLVAIITALWFCEDSWRRHEPAKYAGHRKAADYLATRCPPGDLIVVLGGYNYLPIQFHWRDQNQLRILAAEPGKWVYGQSVLAPRELVKPEELAAWSNKPLWVVIPSKPKDFERLEPFLAGRKKLTSVPFQETFGLGRFEVVHYSRQMMDQ